MRSTTFNSALVNQPKVKNLGNKNRTGCEISIALTISGGLLFILLGFFLLTAFTVFDRNNQALNYTGVGSLVMAFIFFAYSAHFMDKFEENKSRQKRPGIETINRK